MKNETILKTQIVQCSKDKSSGKSPHVTRRAGKSTILTVETFPKETATSMNASMKKERVTKAGEETMVESLRAARQETFYCGLTLPKHMKNHWNAEVAISRQE